ERIEELTYASGDRDVFSILDYRNFLNDYIFPLIPRNSLLLNLLLGVKNEKLEKKEVRKYLNLVMEKTNEPIHFHLIFNLIKTIDKSELLDAKMIEQLKSIPNNIMERHEKYFDNELPSRKQKDLIYYIN